MVATFKDLFISFALVGLFVFAFISFGSILQLENDVNDTILENELINRTFVSLDSDLSAFGGKSETQKKSFETEVPTSGFGSLLLFSIVSAGKVFTGMVTGVYNIIIVLPASILGVSQVAISVLSAILLVVVILGLWRLYKLGG